MFFAACSENKIAGAADGGLNDGGAMDASAISDASASMDSAGGTDADADADASVGIDANPADAIGPQVDLLSGGGDAGVAFANYQWLLSSYLDGNSTHWEQIRDVAFDSVGNFVLVGGTSASNFPTSTGAYDEVYGTPAIASSGLGNAGPTDAFVAKFSPTGQRLWITFLGGPNYDRAYAVEIGPGDDIFVAGRAGANFPTTTGVLQSSFAGDNSANTEYGTQDGFVARFSSSGALVWSTYVGEAGGGFIRDIAVAADGTVHFAATNMSAAPVVAPMVWGAQQTVKGVVDSFYGRLSADGTQLLYGTFIGGTEAAAYSGNPSVRLRPSGGVAFMTYDFGNDVSFVTSGAYQKANAGGSDALLVVFDASDAVVFGTYFGGSGDEDTETHTLAIDLQGNYVISGRTKSTNLPTTAGVVGPSHGGGAPADGFVAVIAADGKSLVASTYVGGSGFDEVEGIAIAADGDIVFGGVTGSTNLATTANPIVSRGANNEAMVGRISPDLKQMRYLSYFGGGGDDAFRGIAVSPNGDVGLCGLTGSANFPTRNAFDSVFDSDSGTIKQAGAFLVVRPVLQ